MGLLEWGIYDIMGGAFMANGWGIYGLMRGHCDLMGGALIIVGRS